MPPFPPAPSIALMPTAADLGTPGTKAPTLGPSATGPQIQRSSNVHTGFGFGFASLLEPPPPGTYATYREMRRDPTISIARAAATLPIKSSPWSYDLNEERGGTDEMVELVKRVLEPKRTRLLNDALLAIDYGWQSWELVWTPRDGIIELEKAKPLLHDVTVIEINPATGDVVGVSQFTPERDAAGAMTGKTRKVVLSGAKVMLFTHDLEGQNWYGRSRHENIREHAWHPWTKMAKRIETYTAKGAGVIFMLEYPGGGEWEDKNGNKITSDDAAAKVMEAVSLMGSIAVPRVIQPGLERMLQNTTNPSQLMQWQMKFIEAASGHGAEMERMQRYYDALKLRGWFVPERTATEGQHGTLAEAESHAELGMAMAADVNDSILETFNGSIVDPLLEFNFGPQARGLVRLRAASVSTEHLAYIRDLTTKLLLDPSNIDLARRVLDLDSMLDDTDTPKLQNVVSIDDPSAPALQPDPIAQSRSRYRRSVGLLLGARGRRVRGE